MAGQALRAGPQGAVHEDYRVPLLAGIKASIQSSLKENAYGSASRFKNGILMSVYIYTHRVHPDTLLIQIYCAYFTVYGEDAPSNLTQGVATGQAYRGLPCLAVALAKAGQPISSRPCRAYTNHFSGSA
jgi:hypothetical protein